MGLRPTKGDEDAPGRSSRINGLRHVFNGADQDPFLTGEEVGMKSAAVLIFLSVMLPLAAQEYRGSLLGRVTDASGAVVVSAAVSVVNEKTNVRSSTETNAEGNFLAPLLEPGSYTVTVEAPGFKKSLRTNVTVRVGERLTLDSQLEVGVVGESVTVEAQTPLLETTNAELSQVVERRFLDLLFIPNRNPINLLSLTPGVSGVGADRFASSAQQSFSIHGGGATEGNNEILVDGASVVMPRQGGSIAASPSGDVVQEIRIQTTMFDASFGRTNGGVISYATRSGTNEIHGSFESFYRNQALEANSWTNNRNNLPRPDTRRQFYSAAAGGPVWLPRLFNGRNRTFFFVSFQHENIRTGSTHIGRTLTDLERRGDFSQTLNSQGGRLDIYDPYSTVVTGATATRQAFAGNRVPAARMNEAGVAIANVFPLPNQSVPIQVGRRNWALVTENSIPARQLTLRMDQVVSNRQRIFGRLGLMTYDTYVAGIPPGLELQGEDFRNFYTLSLNDDYSFGPSLFATLRYSFGRYSSDTIYSAQQQDPRALKLPEILLANALFRSWPRIIMGENLLGTGGRVRYRSNDTHSLVPTLTKLAGRHNLRLGADLRLINWNSIEPGFDGAGSFTFNNTFTRSNPFTAATGNTTGTSMASLLMGIPATGNLGGSTPYSLRHYYFSGFVQDDWKLSPKLTVNLGLRYEVETPYRERYDRLTYGFDFASAFPIRVPGQDLRGGILFANHNGSPRWQGRNDLKNFGPRFGVAYQLRQGTVLRAGYGLYYSSNSGNLDTNTGVPPTFNVAAPYIGTVDNGATAFTNLSNPYPNGLPPIAGNSLGLASRAGFGVSYIWQGRLLPYSQQWQVSIQHALPSKIRLEMAFVRMLSVKGLESFNLNEVPDRYLTLGAEENRRVTNPFFGLFPADTTHGSSTTIVQRQLWLAYPQFTGVTQQGTNSRTTVYHALELSLEKRLSRGLTLLANYTGSKMIENNLTSLVNTRHYRAISDLDYPHIANLAFVYDLPFGAGRALLGGSRGVAARLASGWSLSGRLYLASGTPLSITDTNGRPVRLRNARKEGPVNERLGDRLDPATRLPLNPYFDPTAFVSLPSQYTISPEPPFFSELREPGTKTLDLSLVKRFTVWERVSVDVRADASNLTNTPQFAAPGTSMANRATFGVIQTAGGSRWVQLALRAVF